MKLSWALSRLSVSSVPFRTAAAAIGILLTCSLTPVWAQATSNASVTGLVTDQQGAAIPAVDVRMVNVATSTTLTATTNESGRYVFASVNSGTYNITFDKAGFAQYKVGNQKVDVGSTMTINANMQIGATTTTVEVQAGAGAELQTTSATVGSTMSGESILALPNLGRDVATLAVLQPGVTTGGYTAGAVQDQNTYTLDGGNNSDDMAGNNTSYVTNFTGLGGTQTNQASSGVVPTPVESIEEFRVNTFNQGADFNGSMGSQVQMVTKRGTNQFHGAAYGYYYATNVGAANTWVNNHTPAPSLGLTYTPLPSNHRDRYGIAGGGPIAPNFLGGKWYAFFNYEASRFPNVGTYERPVPSALMRAGVIQVPDASGKYQAYNLNPFPVTVGGTTYQPALCASGANCDPRGIGINPIVSQIWNKQMPLPNDPLYASNGADGFNVEGFLSTIRAPLNQDSWVGRIDHDFSDKWHFMTSYRFMRLVSLTTNQVDIGGALPGDQLGQPAAVAPRDQVPSFFVAGLTTVLSPTTTNSFLYNYTRNFWQWGSANAPPQLPGLGGAVEIASGATNSSAESATAANILIPYNINTQSVRQRFWDGQDNLLKDDISSIHGNHLFQFGGSYQRNYDYHMRTDNGNGINNQIVYQIGSSGINFANTGAYTPSTVPSNQVTNYNNLYSEVLGLVNQPQVAYTRAGANLALQPVGSVAFDQSIIPTYNVYFGDTWHMKPSFTLTYSLGWTLEMPPYELNGKQVVLVDDADNPVTADNYLAQKKAAALNGQAYAPNLGFATIKNVGDGSMKYPFKPIYNQFSPRVAAAWNPKFQHGLLGSMFGDGKTVIRGGYGRIYGRLNGVNLVLVPLLGVGLLQPVTCAGASRTGQCLGAGGVDPTTAFRIGSDGNTAPLPAASQTLSQPFFPGSQFGNATAGDVNTLDPNYRPEVTDNFTFSIQRELSSKMTLEVGYIGRLIRHEMNENNLDAVPYMMTLGGQQFSQAYANTYWALWSGVNPANVGAQPFFETVLGGTGSAYCKGFASCTSAVATNLKSSFTNTAVSTIWSTLSKSPSWILPRTMISGNPLQMTSMGLTTADGYGNYNALFVTWRARDYHGMTAISNFTYGRALGTAATTQASSSLTYTDPFNPSSNYGPNSYDIKFIYNLALFYQPPYFRSQRGLVGHVLGGWTISPLFTAQSGSITAVAYSEGSCTGCQAFGEDTPPGAVGSAAEDAVGTGGGYTGGTSAIYNNAGKNGVGTNSPSAVNMFSDPSQVIKEFRPCVLGYDTSCGGYGNVRGLPTWNLDATVQKDVGVWKEGRVGATLSFQFTNVLNHMQPSNPTLTLTSPTTFGRITSQLNTPRQLEFGLRVHW